MVSGAKLEQYVIDDIEAQLAHRAPVYLAVDSFSVFLILS